MNCPPPQTYANERPCSLATRLPSCNIIYNQSVEPFSDPTAQSENLNIIGPVLDQKWYVPLQTDGRKCYAGFNPILVDGMRAQRLMLDRPHYTGEIAVGNVCNDKIYSKHLRNYGKHYTSYKDITGGQIQYWVSPSSKNAYVEPVFCTPALVDHSLYVDPMGNVKPEYNRLTSAQYDWDKCNQDSCDSFTHDQLEFRQELMEKQMRKRNQQEWKFRF